MRKEIVFSSIESFSDYLNQPTCKLFKGKMLQSQSIGNRAKRFTGTYNYDEANKMLLNGWSYGTDKLLRRLKDIKVKEQNKETNIYDVVGYQASVPRYLNGIPTSMINKKRYQQKPVLNLYKDVSYANNVNEKTILEDSVKVLKLIKMLETKGVKTNLYVIFGAYEGNVSVVMKLKLKGENENLNISKISYPLLHPSFIRRHVFRMMEVTENVPYPKKMVNTMGYAMFPEQLANTIKNNEVFIPKLISDEGMMNIIKTKSKLFS